MGSLLDIITLEQIQNRALQFIFRLRDRASFTDLPKKTNIESLKINVLRKTVRLNLYCKSIDNNNGVIISDTRCNAPLKTHNTRQKYGLYIPSMKKLTLFFQSFGPGQLGKLGKAFI